MRTVFRLFLTAFVALNLAMGGVVADAACRTATAMKQGCCCCGGQAMQDGGCSKGSVNIVSAEGCGCALKSGDGQTASEFTLNNTPDKLQFTVLPPRIATAAAHILNSLVIAKSVKDFCAFESPPLFKLTSSYLC